jgi:hypothetical protein
MDPIAITDLRGGLNTTDPPFSLPADQLVVCQNVDLSRGTLGGRRRGHAAVTVSGFYGSGGAVPFLHRHLPSADETAAELWAVTTSGTSSKWMYKDTTWHQASLASASLALDVAQGQYAVRAQSLHGKLFLAYPTASGVDRLSVWDGTNIRSTGLAEPAAPSVANTGSGTYATTRYFRVRYTTQSSGITVRRSEPSTATTFAPSGTGLSARVTKPAAISEGETHWEIEESIDNANFYRIATVVVGTTTYDDSLAATSVATTGTLSEDIGDYTTLHMPKFLSADGDRLLFAGSHEQPALASRVGWTPVFGAAGVGNDERQEDDTDPFLDLDNFDGGEITEFMGPVSGYHYAFKEQRIYKIVRTYARSRAYQALPLTDASGAMKRSGVKGRDESGRPCIYYLDRAQGPSRVGMNGVEHCGGDIHETWKDINKDATLIGHGIYYPETKQVWWWVAGAGQSFPSFKIVANVTEFRPGVDGTRRGWSMDTGASMATLSACLFSDNINANTTRSRTLVPFVGTAISSLPVLRCDTGTTDAGTTYRAYWKTRPFILKSLLQKGGVMDATLMAEASDYSFVLVTGVRDFGLESLAKLVELTPEAAEDHVVRRIDDFQLADLRALQLEVGDQAARDQDWVLDALVLRMRDEEST